MVKNDYMTGNDEIGIKDEGDVEMTKEMEEEIVFKEQ